MPLAKLCAPAVCEVKRRWTSVHQDLKLFISVLLDSRFSYCWCWFPIVDDSFGSRQEHILCTGQLACWPARPAPAFLTRTLRNGIWGRCPDQRRTTEQEQEAEPRPAAIASRPRSLPARSSTTESARGAGPTKWPLPGGPRAAPRAGASGAPGGPRDLAEGGPAAGPPAPACQGVQRQISPLPGCFTERQRGAGRESRLWAFSPSPRRHLRLFSSPQTKAQLSLKRSNNVRQSAGGKNTKIKKEKKEKQ